MTTPHIKSKTETNHSIDEMKFTRYCEKKNKDFLIAWTIFVLVVSFIVGGWEYLNINGLVLPWEAMKVPAIIIMCFVWMITAERWIERIFDTTLTVGLKSNSVAYNQPRPDSHMCYPATINRIVIPDLSEKGCFLEPISKEKNWVVGSGLKACAEKCEYKIFIADTRSSKVQEEDQIEDHFDCGGNFYADFDLRVPLAVVLENGIAIFIINKRLVPKGLA